MPNFADLNLNIYLNGLGGEKPALPLTYDELEQQARERLDDVLYDYVAGGAGNEQTQRENVSALAQWGIVPRMLTGVAVRDLSIELFGRRYPSPVMMAPIGVVGIMHESGHGDIEVARAAAATGVPMIGSTLMQDPMEDVFAEAGETPSFYQLYTPNDRELAESFVARAEAAGVAGIVVTLDTWTLGWRPRDLRHASMPQLQGLCLANYFSDPVFRAKLEKTPEEDPGAATLAWAGTFGSPELCWNDVPWLRSLTTLPILLKGICHPDDVRRARDLGVDGIYCSTHGGRQAVSAPAVGFLPGVVEAADGMPVIFDSGIRTGVDIVRALALGATAVAVGRPYGWGITLDGAAGAAFVLRSLLAEADLTMGLNGYRTVADLRGDALVSR
ncbi:MAG: alpha-hydroxy-acid oxidizing protein [Aeromicrobium sp.]